LSKFDDLVAGQQKAAQPGELIEGSFGCHYCWEIVDEATYFPKEKRLVYKHENHESTIEGFEL
jgi:hypothetical protein